MARVRLALLDCCEAAVLVKEQLVQEGVASSSLKPNFPLEKLQEAFQQRCEGVPRDTAMTALACSPSPEKQSYQSCYA
jgi:hypothetical protein